MTLRKRLIFTLLYRENNFCLSRNFRLQSVGDIRWLLDKFHFESLANSIDELIVLNVGNVPIEETNILRDIQEIAKEFFIPISIGGGIRNLKTMSMLFNEGADKVVLNSAYYLDPDFCISAVQEFGSQAVVASVDLKKSIQGDGCYKLHSYVSNEENKSPTEHINRIFQLGAGEIMLRSVDRDGTSNGLDLGIVNVIPPEISTPLIVSGGSGKAEHLLEGILHNRIEAVATANLLNFVGNGFQNARDFVYRNGGEITPNSD